MSSTEDSPRPQKRQRSSVACNRCKERRQKVSSRFFARLFERLEFLLISVRQCFACML